MEDILRWLLERRVRRRREDRRHRNAEVPNNLNEDVDAFLETLGLAKDDRRDEEKECKTFSDGYLVLREADTVQVAYKSSVASDQDRRMSPPP